MNILLRRGASVGFLSNRCRCGSSSSSEGRSGSRLTVFLMVATPPSNNDRMRRDAFPFFCNHDHNYHLFEMLPASPRLQPRFLFCHHRFKSGFCGPLASCCCESDIGPLLRTRTLPDDLHLFKTLAPSNVIEAYVCFSTWTIPSSGFVIADRACPGKRDRVSARKARPM